MPGLNLIREQVYPDGIWGNTYFCSRQSTFKDSVMRIGFTWARVPPCHWEVHRGVHITQQYRRCSPRWCFFPCHYYQPCKSIQFPGFGSLGRCRSAFQHPHPSPAVAGSTASPRGLDWGFTNPQSVTLSELGEISELCQQRLCRKLGILLLKSASSAKAPQKIYIYFTEVWHCNNILKEKWHCT